MQSPEERHEEIKKTEVAKATQEAKSEVYDRSTVIAFGLLFVLPTLIILFAMLLLLPFINRSLSEDTNSGGAIRQNSPSNLAPSR